MADAVGPSDAKVGIVAGSRRIKQRGSGYFKRKHSRHVPQDDDAVIAQALNILSRRIRHNDFLASPADVRDFLRVLLADREHEILVWCCWMPRTACCLAKSYFAARSHKPPCIRAKS